MLGLLLLSSIAGVSGPPDASCEVIGSYLYQPSHCIDHLLREPAEPYIPQPGDIMLATDPNHFWSATHNLALAFEPHGSGIVVALPDRCLGILEAGPTDVHAARPQEILTPFEKLARRLGSNDTVWVAISDVLPHLHDYESKGRVWMRRRRVPLTEEESCRLTDFALRQDGKRFALTRLTGQLTPFRTRGPIRTYFVGKPHGDRRAYYCSELVTEACVAAGLIDAADARPSATYPHDLFVEKSLNPFLRHHFNLSPCWYPPARWTHCPHGAVAEAPPALIRE